MTQEFPRHRPSQRKKSYLIGFVSLCVCLGCHSEESLPPQESVEATDRAIQEDLESWDVIYLQGNKVGYAHNKVSQTVEDGRTLNRIEMINRLLLTRFGQTNDTEIKLTCIETPEGEVLSFKTIMSMGPVPMIATGKRDGDRFVVTTRTKGREEESELAAKDIGGFYAADQSLLNEPLEPGQTRSLRTLSPGMPYVVVATVDLAAKEYESTQLLDRTVELLRIESTTTLPDGSLIEMLVWTDRHGVPLKTRIDAMRIETFRASREVALEETDDGNLDLGFDSIVRTKRRIPDAHNARRIRYRVRLKNGDPSAVFASGPTQQVRSTGADVAELTVTSLKLSADSDLATDEKSTEEDSPTAADRLPNDLIQSDDPQVIQMAQQVVPDEQDQRKIALALEQLVHETISTKNFSMAFGTAAEVAEYKEGDCTEHAVLLAALARARGIPARVAIGLVYVDSMRGFGYHMWTETFVDGRWASIDATLATGGIGAAHLKLAHSNLQGSSAFSCFLPVANVLGQLEIEVLEIE